MRFIGQLIVILLSGATVAAIVYTPVFPFTPVFLVFLVLLGTFYALVKKRKKHIEVFSGNNKEIYIILVAILLVVFYTGGIKSVVFFLTYFILFGIAFIFEPIIIFLFLLVLGALFIPEVIQDDIFGNSVRLGSLLFLAPIAFFFGREYKRREKLKLKVSKTTEHIITEAEELINSRDTSTKLKKAEQIIEEAKELKKESKQ